MYADEQSALSDILDKASAGLPEPSPTLTPDPAPDNKESDGSNHAPFASPSPSPSPFNSGNVIQDDFNPALHETDGAGNPVRNADGSYRRKRGRKTGVNYGVGGDSLGASMDSMELAELAKRKAAAKTAVQLLVMGGVSIFGPEWQPIHDKASGVNERLMLEGAFENYFEAAGTIDLPPGLALALTVGAYALPRFQLPATQEKAAKISGGIRGWFGQWKANRAAHKMAIAA